MDRQFDNQGAMEAAATVDAAARREGGTPFYFGAYPARLYACLHQPAADTPIQNPVLICNAAWHEYERCHKAMRQLAVQLVRAGSPALRFDYSGTGDSAGDGESASLAGWRADIHAALDELRRRTGQRRVSLIGLRVGATLAAQVAAQRDDIDQLVLYAPVTDGRALLQEWHELQAAHDHAHGIQSAQSEVLGYPLTDAFRNELHDSLQLPAPSAAVRRVLICTQGNVGVGDAVMQRLAGNGAAVTAEASEDAAIWRREPMDALVPFKLIRRIVGWLQERAP